MIRVILPSHFYSGELALSDEMIQDICSLSCNDSDFVKVCENRGKNTGQYIKLDDNGRIKYICLSGPSCSVARNSYILQNFPTAYQHYLEETSSNKCFEYYIRDFSSPHAAYILFSYKLLLTIGIRILNLNRVEPSPNARINNYGIKFLTLQEMRSCRLKLQSRNEGNESTLFEENDDEIALYGKTYGANGRETGAICLALAKLGLRKPIVVYNVNETDPAHLASVDPANRAIMSSVGAVLSDSIVEIPEEELTEEQRQEREVKRSTAKYHYNLLQKFGNKRCYLCGCDIESLIIGSHIHRYADIKNSNLPREEKMRQITDGENGLRLCEDHDKMFEDGIIYFEGDQMKIKGSITGLSREFVDKVTFNMRKIYYDGENDENVQTILGNNIFKIKEEDYTEEMHNYLEIHKARVLNL